MSIKCLPKSNCGIHTLHHAWEQLVHLLEWLQSPALLLARWYVAYVFFMSGLQSLRDWDGTLWLYDNEFHILFMPPHIAAVFGVAGEVLLPPLLALGLFGRFSALGLFVVNVVALLSYMYALQPPAIMFHFIWAILLTMPILWGPGKWSIDAWRQSKR
ncbi:MAG: DoxX family protein [Sulfuriferula sp.]